MQHLYIYALVPDILAWQKLTLVRLSPGHSAAEVRNFKVGIMSGTQGTDVSTSNDWQRYLDKQDHKQDACFSTKS